MAVKWQSFVFLFWLCWVFIVVHELFVKASGFSLQWLFLLQSTGSRVHGFSRCSMQVELPYGMWDFSSLTRDWTHFPFIGRQILNHWTTWEVLRWQSFGLQTHHCWWNLHYCMWCYPFIRQAFGNLEKLLLSLNYFQSHLPSQRCDFLPSTSRLWCFTRFSSHITQFFSLLQRQSASIAPLEHPIHLPWAHWPCWNPEYVPLVVSVTCGFIQPGAEVAFMSKGVTLGYSILM